MEKINHKDIQDKLWSNEDESNLSNEQYNQLLIEQYRIYVELTDRTSYRRIVINLFFLVSTLFLQVQLLQQLVIISMLKIHHLVFLLLYLISQDQYSVMHGGNYQIFQTSHTNKNSIVPSLEKRLPSKVWLTEEHIAEQKDLSSRLEFLRYTCLLSLWVFIQLCSYLLSLTGFHIH